MVRVALVLFATYLLPCGVRAGDPSPVGSEAARQSINLEALSRLKGIDLEANPAVKAVLLKLLEQVRGTPQFVDLVRDFNLKDQETALLEFAAHAPSGPAGAEAARLVLRRADPSLFKQALEGADAVGLVEALGNTGDRAVVALLQPLVLDSGRSLVLRKQAVHALAKLQEGATALVEMLRLQRLPDELKAAVGVELRAVRWNDIKAQAAQWLPPMQSDTLRVLPPISELVKRPGDPAKGADVFRRDTVGCLKCHQVNGSGTDFGPNLSEIGTKLAKNALYESILDPSAGIAFGYEAWQLDLTNGDDAVGLIISETADEIVLKMVGGIVTRYKKADVTRRVRQKLSIMPVGLEQTMSTQDLVDLIEYLSSLKKAER